MQEIENQSISSLDKKQRHLGGRPRHFDTELSLESAIQSYFDSGLKLKKIPIGKHPNIQIVEIPTPTITGLAFHLGFESRQSIYDYEKEGLFSYVMKRARLRIEQHYEELLQGNTPTGAIFALKNFGWRDDHGIEHSGKIENVSVSIRQEE